MDDTNAKTCPRCSTVFPLESFPFRSRATGERYPYCKPCKAAYRREWEVKNPEKHAAALDRNRESGRIRATEYRKANPERFAEVQARYRAKNPTRTAAWFAANPEKRLAYKQNRRSRVMGGGGSFSAAEWRALCTHYGNVCVCCNRPRQLTADHVVAVALGGSSFIENIQPLCGPCNSAKSTQTIDYRPDKGAGIERIPKTIRDPKPRQRKKREPQFLGEGHTNSKLTNEQVIEIRRRHAEDRHTFTEIAQAFGVNLSTVSRIVRRMHWTHI